MTSRLKQLGSQGQAVWLDFVDRSFLKEGGVLLYDSDNVEPSKLMLITSFESSTG